MGRVCAEKVAGASSGWMSGVESEGRLLGVGGR